MSKKRELRSTMLYRKISLADSVVEQTVAPYDDCSGFELTTSIVRGTTSRVTRNRYMYGISGKNIREAMDQEMRLLALGSDE